MGKATVMATPEKKNLAYVVLMASSASILLVPLFTTALIFCLRNTPASLYSILAGLYTNEGGAPAQFRHVVLVLVDWVWLVVVLYRNLFNAVTLILVTVILTIATRSLRCVSANAKNIKNCKLL